MPSNVVPHYRPCLLLWCLTINTPVGVFPHYRPCLLVWCLIINHVCWRVASLYAMPSGMVPHYHQCLLVWCLTICHAFWCGASLSATPVGVVSHYRPCQLVWYLTIGHSYWSFATAINILLVGCRWKKDGFKSGATCMYRGVIILYLSADPVPLSDMPICTVQLYRYIYSDTCVCKVLLYQARHLVYYKSIIHAYM